MSTIGAYIYTMSSFLDCRSLEISGHSVEGFWQLSDESSVLFLEAYFSSVIIKDSTFSDNMFSDGGFLSASLSEIIIEETNFTSL